MQTDPFRNIRTARDSLLPLRRHGAEREVRCLEELYG